MSIQPIFSQKFVKKIVGFLLNLGWLMWVCEGVEGVEGVDDVRLLATVLQFSGCIFTLCLAFPTKRTITKQNLTFYMFFFSYLIFHKFFSLFFFYYYWFFTIFWYVCVFVCVYQLLEVFPPSYLFRFTAVANNCSKLLFQTFAFQKITKTQFNPFIFPVAFSTPNVFQDSRFRLWIGLESDDLGNI